MILLKKNHDAVFELDAFGLLGLEFVCAWIQFLSVLVYCGHVQWGAGCAHSNTWRGEAVGSAPLKTELLRVGFRQRITGGNGYSLGVPIFGG